MKNPFRSVVALIAIGSSAWFAAAQIGSAQSASPQQAVQQARQQLIQNQQRLSHYYWQMTQTVSVRGEVKQQTLYRVELGPDGKAMKTVLSQSSNGGTQRRFGVRHRIEEDYKQYAQSVGALAQSYGQLNPSTIQQLYAQGRVSLKSAGSPGYAQIVILGYLKPGDSVVLTMQTSPKALIRYNVSSYLSGPSDAVSMQAQFGRLADGTRYVSKLTVNGQSKDLTITQQSSNFELRQQ